MCASRTLSVARHGYEGGSQFRVSDGEFTEQATITVGIYVAPIMGKKGLNCYPVGGANVKDLIRRGDSIFIRLNRAPGQKFDLKGVWEAVGVASFGGYPMPDDIEDIDSWTSGWRWVGFVKNEKTDPGTGRSMFNGRNAPDPNATMTAVLMQGSFTLKPAGWQILNNIFIGDPIIWVPPPKPDGRSGGSGGSFRDNVDDRPTACYAALDWTCAGSIMKRLAETVLKLQDSMLEDNSNHGPYFYPHADYDARSAYKNGVPITSKIRAHEVKRSNLCSLLAGLLPLLRLGCVMIVSERVSKLQAIDALQIGETIAIVNSSASDANVRAELKELIKQCTAARNDAHKMQPSSEYKRWVYVKKSGAPGWSSSKLQSVDMSVADKRKDFKALFDALIPQDTQDRNLRAEELMRDSFYWLVRSLGLGGIQGSGDNDEDHAMVLAVLSSMLEPGLTGNAKDVVGKLWYKWTRETVTSMDSDEMDTFRKHFKNSFGAMENAYNQERDEIANRIVGVAASSVSPGTDAPYTVEGRGKKNKRALDVCAGRSFI